MNLSTEGPVFRLGLMLAALLCLLGCGLIFLLPPDSLVTDLVYRAF
jgi:hypothetical protein